MTEEEKEYPYRLDMSGDTRLKDWHSEAREILEKKKTLKFSVTPGRVRVNHEAGVRLILDTDDAKVFSVDMHSKYGGEISTIFSGDRIGFELHPSEYTIYLDESANKDTIFWVDGLKGVEGGWVDLAVWRRYSFHVCLFRSRILETDEIRSIEVEGEGDGND